MNLDWSSKHDNNAQMSNTDWAAEEPGGKTVAAAEAPRAEAPAEEPKHGWGRLPSGSGGAM